MSIGRWVLGLTALLMSGCAAPSLRSIDQAVAHFASQPWDMAPARGANPRAAQRRGDSPAPAPATGSPSPAAPGASTPTGNVIRTSYPQVEGGPPGQVAPSLRQFQLKIPPEVPGAETPVVSLPRDRAERDAAVAQLFPELPPLAEEPVPLPGPNGQAYTLDELQRLAAANSPAMRQAVSDVEAARGLLQQAATYPNPLIGYEAGPNNNNTATGTQGFFVDQVIRTGGKVTLQAAAAQMDLRNAELALKRARSDLATQVRMAYYNFVVARETVRINKALARYTDEIYRLQADLLGGNFAATHEPAALRAQAFTIRLSYSQAITGYVYAWKQLVAAIGLQQLPLSEVEGEVDRLIPFYEYDTVLAHILEKHTDVLTARNAIQKARYNLKLAQVTPVPDVDVRADLWKENTVLPLQNFHAVTVSIPFPIWDKNRGNIRAATSGLVRAGEGPHQVELALTTGLAAAYTNYKSNLAAVEYYRRYILPDQVRYYRGVFERRRIDPNASFNDVVTAQQTLAADVTAYLGVLGQLWTSVVNVADYLQTNDLYQLGQPLELPQLPDLEALHALPCPHPQFESVPIGVLSLPATAPGAAGATAAAARAPFSFDPWIRQPLETAVAYFARNPANPDHAVREPDRKPPSSQPAPGLSTALAAPSVASPDNLSAMDSSRRPRASGY